MELVYLWVEDYKNIKKQGFNFSPRFECEFHDKYDDNGKLEYNCKLEIIEKKDDEYIKDFFGENINVTAIVGKNGSGKSNILNAIVNCIENDETMIEKYILVFQNDNNKCSYFSWFDIKTSLKKLEIGNQSLAIYLDRLDNDNLPINMGSTQLMNQERANSHFLKYIKIDTRKERIIRLLVLEIGKIDSSFKLSTFMYLPNKIFIELKTPEELISDHIAFILTDRQEVENYFMSLNDIKHQLLIINYLKKGRKTGDNILEKIKNIDELEDFKNSKDILELINEKEFIINDLSDEEKNIYMRKNGYEHLLNFDLMDEKGRRYNNLSHGEKSIFGQLLNIYFYATYYTNLIFLFDEPEISLHPDWQKRYMSELLKLLKKMEGKNHFIFTSHSPFLLSDIPKQNIIFLDKDKNGNCKVVDGLNDKKQTFGANIHTLLSDSFFMEKGLMGEFAKQKINEIIAFFDNKNELYTNDQKKLLQIINFIGEPFLKDKLLFMYDEKYPKTDAEKILELEKQIESIKNGQDKI